MARTGRPPKPVEEHKRAGTFRPDRHGKSDIVVALPRAVEAPEAPGHLGEAGAAFWVSVWTSGAVWLSPATDMARVVTACELIDAKSKAHARYMATSDPADARALATIHKSLSEALSALGFDPVSRTRLGVAQVQAASAVENLIRRKHA